MTIRTGPTTQNVSQMMERFVAWTDQMRTRASNLTPVMEIIADDIKEMALEASREHQTPKGVPHPPLSPTTLELYAKGPYGGSTGRLANSLQVSVTRTAATITSDLPYAAAQFYGNPNNKIYGKASAPVPARPYIDIENGELAFPEAITEEWEEMVLNYIVEGELP